jgi:hypothetical protein
MSPKPKVCNIVLQVRAAMFDDAVTRTNDVKRRTQGFVKNMWQSLE